MPAILRQRHLFVPAATPVPLRRDEAYRSLQWLHPLVRMYASDPTDRSPTQRTALIVLVVATPILALALLLFILTFQSRAKTLEARKTGLAHIGDPQLIPEPPKTYIPHPPIQSDTVKIPPMMGMVEERPMPEPQTNYRPGGTPIGDLPSLEVTPPSRPHSVAATPHTSRTPRTLRTPRTPHPAHSPRSPRGHDAVPPGTPFGDVSDQPLSANSLERMINKMESELKSPARF